MNLLCSAEWTSSSVQTQPDPTRIFQEATKDECLIEMKEGADSPNAVQISRPVHVSFQQPDSIVYSISVSLFPPLSLVLRSIRAGQIPARQVESGVEKSNNIIIIIVRREHNSICR